MSHVSTPLLSAFTNSGIDPWVPSLNLRSYVAVHRPGIGNIGAGKSNETVSRISREGVSTVSGILISFFLLINVIATIMN